jgi:hypothetical protein
MQNVDFFHFCIRTSSIIIHHSKPILFPPEDSRPKGVIIEMRFEALCIHDFVFIIRCSSPCGLGMYGGCKWAEADLTEEDWVPVRSLKSICYRDGPFQSVSKRIPSLRQAFHSLEFLVRAACPEDIGSSSQNEQ